MEVIPVLDLMQGHVVRGVAGRRETYAPLQSLVAQSSKPLDVARAIRDEFRVRRLYVADLDGIISGEPQWPLLESLAADGFDLLVDAGLRTATRAQRLMDIGVADVVAALETLPGPQELSDLLGHIGPTRIVFSLDLMAGKPMGDLSAWETADPASVAQRAIDLGVTSLIVLDLSAVGMNGGVPTRCLCERLRRDHSHLTLLSGGGVRNLSDLLNLRQAGVDAALVASALHDGRITRADMASLSHAAGTGR